MKSPAITLAKIAAILGLFASIALLPGCAKGPGERTGEAIHDAAESVGDAAEDVGDEIEDAVDEIDG